MAGDILQYVVPGSSAVFHFDLEFNLTIDEVYSYIHI